VNVLRDISNLFNILFCGVDVILSTLFISVDIVSIKLFAL